jgi:hypothetical protein
MQARLASTDADLVGVDKYVVALAIRHWATRLAERPVDDAVDVAHLLDVVQEVLADIGHRRFLQMLLDFLAVGLGLDSPTAWTPVRLVTIVGIMPGEGRKAKKK